MFSVSHICFFFLLQFSLVNFSSFIMTTFFSVAWKHSTWLLFLCQFHYLGHLGSFPIDSFSSHWSYFIPPRLPPPPLLLILLLINKQSCTSFFIFLYSLYQLSCLNSNTTLFLAFLRLWLSPGPPRLFPECECMVQGHTGI